MDLNVLSPANPRLARLSSQVTLWLGYVHIRGSKRVPGISTVHGLVDTENPWPVPYWWRRWASMNARPSASWRHFWIPGCSAALDGVQQRGMRSCGHDTASRQ